MIHFLLNIHVIGWVEKKTEFKINGKVEKTCGNMYKLIEGRNEELTFRLLLLENECTIAENDKEMEGLVMGECNFNCYDNKGEPSYDCKNGSKYNAYLLVEHNSIFNDNSYYKTIRIHADKLKMIEIDLNNKQNKNKELDVTKMIIK